MATQPRKKLFRRRRRLEDEGEDEGSITEHINDSQSEASLPSDDDGDADDSLSETDVPDTAVEAIPTGAKRNGAVKPPKTSTIQQDTEPATPTPTTKELPAHTTTEDTHVMMNGLHLSDRVEEAEALEFETVDGPVPSTTVATEREGESLLDLGQESREEQEESFGDKKRREHEEYKQRREQDPAFIPNRGAFFMHDQRSSASGANGFRPGRGGRGGARGGRGGAIGGPFSPAKYVDHVTSTMIV